ncbi:hypothetical protein OG333_11170 [Streptomyces anulatus]|uniref:hypothetical protein n=1 Tax=Streptomyces TaxID=1883 RepID=UPI000BF1584B|nr:hypothetical protein [Streptomyces sp. or20]WSV74891.1 hypothetical protein OG333_11170 [Streptomyces anulatus]
MQVLFLALGASRKRAVLDESAELRASGAQVIVVVDKKKSWLNQEFAPGVVVTTLKELEARHLPRRMEHALLYRVPRATVRAVGRGPLRGRARRGLKAYERGLAAKLHRKVFVPAHRRLWPDAQARMVLAPFAARGGLDLLVVSDALSVPRAVRLLDAWATDGIKPRVCYGLDYDVPSGTQQARPATTQGQR